MNHYWTDFAELKVTAGSPATVARGGETTMPRKQGFTSPNLPGKASDGFAKAKAGYKEVNGYANYAGLSKKKNWIAGAIKHPGAEKRAAAKAGMSTHAYMEKHKHDSGTAGKRARLGLTLSKMAHHRKG